MSRSSFKFTALDAFVDKSGPICYGILKPGENYPGGIPVIKVKNIVGGRVLESGLLHTSPEIHNQYKRAEVKPGDLLLTIRGTTGRVAFVPRSLNGANITQDTARIRVSSDDSPRYVYYALQSPDIQRQIELNTVGQAVKGINIGEVRKLSIYHPGLQEQQKIALVLSTWDQAIAAAEKLLENSHQQKRGLMQQLLVGKQRFPKFRKDREYQKTKYGEIPADWKFVSLASIAMQVSKKNSEGKDFPVLSCSKHFGFVNSLDYFNKKVYSSDVSGYKVINKGCFGFPSNHIEEGSIGYQNICATGLVSPIYIVFKANEQLVNNEFLYALLKSEHYKQIFSAATNASVDRRGSLRWDDFSKIKVQLPSLEEQEIIVSLLTAADHKISALQAKLDCLRQEKKALMQQLLTGRRRVKIDELEVA